MLIRLFAVCKHIFSSTSESAYLVGLLPRKHLGDTLQCENTCIWIAKYSILDCAPAERFTAGKSARLSLYSFVCLCLVGSGVEGAALSRESIHSNASQSIITSAAANTGQHTHTALLLSTQVNTHSLTPTYTNTMVCTHTHRQGLSLSNTKLKRLPSQIIMPTFVLSD